MVGSRIFDEMPEAGFSACAFAETFDDSRTFALIAAGSDC
jgi:hypothetical protein